jgi:hypothetical protein
MQPERTSPQAAPRHRPPGRPLLACGALLAALAGCVGASPERGNVAEPVAVPDGNQLQAQSLVFYLELLHRFAKAGPAEQSEIFANIRRDYETAPTPSSELRYALAVATPNHPSTDAALAQKLLRQLLSAPETMTPVEHAAAFLELQKIDRQLALAADNKRLRSDSDRTERERLAAVNRRLAAETEENARLRKSLKRKARILVVDDDPGLLRLLTIRLRAENYEVEAVESAAPALAAAALPPRPRRHRPAHGPDGRHRPAEGAAEPLAGPEGHHPHRARHDPRRGAGDAERRLRLPDQAGRQAGAARPGAARAEDLRLPEAATRTGARDHHAQRRDGREAGAGAHGRRHRRARADHRRERHRQELLARAIHKASPRRDKPVRRDQLQRDGRELLESELFGHEKGAFTGAIRSTAACSRRPTAAR